MNNNNTIKASKELVDLIDELKDNLTNVKYLFSKIEKMARDEGLEADEIDDMIYQKYKYNLSPSSSNATINTINNNTKISSIITTTTNTTHNNNKIDEKKYFQRYFQHFQ